MANASNCVPLCIGHRQIGRRGAPPTARPCSTCVISVWHMEHSVMKKALYVT